MHIPFVCTWVPSQDLIFSLFLLLLLLLLLLFLCVRVFLSPKASLLTVSKNVTDGVSGTSGYGIGNRYMVTLIECSVRALEGVSIRTGMSFSARAALLTVLVRDERGTHSASVLCL